MPDFPSTLYYASAFLCAITIPKHILVGFKHVYKAIAKIPPSPEYALGKALAPTSWDFGVGSLAILALLNYKWATTGGPGSSEENWVIYTYMGTGGFVGWQYFKINMLSPLGFLWVAPFMATVASFLQ